MFQRFHNIGTAGWVPDVPSYELPPEAWSTVSNARFQGVWAERVKGGEDAYNITVSAATATQTLAISPWFIMPVQDSANYFWLYAGANHIYGANNTSNRNLLTRTAAGSEVLYSASANMRWQGAQLGGVAIMNNGVDVPQYWPSIGLTTRFENMRWDNSANTTWATRTAGPVTCGVFRTFREFGLALNTTENGTNYPRRLRWSHPVASGLPATWDESRTGMDAGYKDFEEDADLIQDCATLFNQNIVYKDQTTWAMQYIGGRNVFAWQKLFTQSGILAPNCVAAFNGNHFVVTAHDIIVHNGQSIQSVAQKKVRDWFFANLSNDYYRRTYTVVDADNEEIWVCFTSNGVRSYGNYFPDYALIWNWRFGTWTIRNVASAPHIASGIVAQGGTATTWASDTGTWSDDDGAWGDSSYRQGSQVLLQAYTWLTDYALVKLNTGNDYRGDAYSFVLERQALPLGQDGKTDIHSIKSVRGVWPYIDGTDGTAIKIYIGTQMRLSDGISWKGPYTYTIGSSTKVNVRASGRVISIRFESLANDAIKVSGFGIDWDVEGRY